MRLIDADELLARIRLNYNNHQNISAYSVKDIINTTKTAYDVDKVVESLDKALIDLNGGTSCGECVFKDVCDDGYDGCVETVFEVCKSIVRKGGAE